MDSHPSTEHAEGVSEDRPTRDDGYEVTTLPEEEQVNIEGRKELGALDIFSLIVNKMIGTGVFTAPAQVFLLTGWKTISILMWVIGFVYSILSMWVYLDYTSAMPFTGGELVYVAELTAHSGRSAGDSKPEAGPGQRFSPLSIVLRKWFPTPWYDRGASILERIFADGMFAYTLYSILFVTVFSSSTNVVQFGAMILVVTGAREHRDDELGRNYSISNISAPMARVIGVLTLTLLSILQMFQPKLGRGLNVILAVVKLTAVVILLAFGIAAATNNRGGWSDWSVRYETPTKSKNGWAKALLAVLFSYQGWENATFVAGELDMKNQGKLWKGFIWAVAVVGGLYTAVAVFYLAATRYDDLKSSGDIFFPPKLLGNNAASTEAWGVIVAISALGNVNAILYTFSRVKQAIGDANILPWSRIWKSDYIVHQDRGRDDIMNVSPKGGLLLHWIFSVLLVAASSAIKSTTESIIMPGSLQTYAHAFVQLVLSALFYRLPAREKALDLYAHIPPHLLTWRLSTFHWLWQWLVVILLLIVSMAMLVVNGLPPFVAADGGPVTFPGDQYPKIVFGVIGGGIVYYLVVLGLARRHYIRPETFEPLVPVPEEREEPGPLEKTDGHDSFLVLLNILRSLFFIKPSFWVDEWYAAGAEGDSNEVMRTRPLKRVMRFGRRWIIVYTMHRAHRPEGSDLAQQPLHFWYWVFGGRSVYSTDPPRPFSERFEEWWRAKFPWLMRPEQRATENHELGDTRGPEV